MAWTTKCRTLPIPSAYCICQYGEKNVTDRVLIVKLGKFLAKQFNQLLRDNRLTKKCQKQFYSEAYISSNSSGLTLSSGFSRLNKYGSQGDCLLDNPLRPLCHCKNSTERSNHDEGIKQSGKSAGIHKAVRV
ncbi:hypothetical protein KIN20_003574 [Parelaphostrongylus tenuis]|uniref:Uncharacterized protein n=1 Tax=Parelaphostrongylus tenuis TaxID=148309 RepID=A0AAD5MIK3_PARTN|nr:hypothetical protein KIN20_003574 [Parelaphostrongylus tenuis]